MTLHFVIPGEPAPKGSRVTGTRKDGSIYTREASKRAKPWLISASQKLWITSREQGVKFGAVPLKVTVLFECERPAKPTYDWPSRSDSDKYLRALGDALSQSGAIVDDRHIIWWNAAKRFTDGEPRTIGRVELAHAAPALSPFGLLHGVEELVA